MKPSLFAVSVGIIAPALVASTPAASQETPLFSLDTIQVQVDSRVSNSFPAPGRMVEVVTREQIANLPVRTLADVLRWSNSIELQQRSAAQSDVSIRGAGFEQVLVLVDGVRVSDAQTGHFDLDLTVPADRVERVEILRGAASALYGADAVGGVINIVTRDGANGWTGRIEGGSFGGARGALTGIGTFGSVTTAGGGEYSRSDGHRDGTDLEVYQGHGSVSLPLFGGSARIEGGGAHRDFGASQFYAPIESFEQTRTARASMTWLSPESGGFQSEARVSFRRHHDRFVFFRNEPERGENVHDGNQFGAELTGRYTGSENWALAIGGEAFSDDLSSTGLGERDAARGAVFGELVLNGAGPASSTLGARIDYDEEFGWFVSPSLSAAYDASQRIRIRGSVGRAFRAPTFTERYYRDSFHEADPTVAVERNWSYEAGVDVLPTGGSLRLTGYHRRSSGLIDWAKPDGADDDVKWVTRNVDQANFSGIEFDAQIDRLLGARWTAGLSLLYLETEEEAAYFSKRALRPESRRAVVGVSRRLGSSVDLAARALYAKRIDQSDYHMFDLRLGVRGGPGQFYLELNNLTDHSYLDIAGQEAAGRSVVIGYSATTGGD